jgi:hypothetical protein
LASTAGAESEQRLNSSPPTYLLPTLVWSAALLSIQVSAAPSVALDERTYASLRRLFQSMRQEQICDIEGHALPCAELRESIGAFILIARKAM